MDKASGSLKETITLKRKRGRSSIFAAGEPMVWLTAGSLILCVLMIVGLLALVFYFGMATFWPAPVLRFITTANGVYLGEVTRKENVQIGNKSISRRLVRTGNYKITQTHFKWLDNSVIREESKPKWAFLLERLEWGRFYGYLKSFVFVSYYLPENLSAEKRKTRLRAYLKQFKPTFGGKAMLMAKVFKGGKMQNTLLPLEKIEQNLKLEGIAEVVDRPEVAWKAFQQNHKIVRRRWRQRRRLEKVDIGKINEMQNSARLDKRAAQLRLEDAEKVSGLDSAEYKTCFKDVAEAEKVYQKCLKKVKREFAKIRFEIEALDKKNSRYLLLLDTAGEGTAIKPQSVMLGLDQIVRAFPPNQLGFGGRLSVYLSRWGEYLWDEPREANSEGGVFPAIFGTVLMTIIMAFAVVPFGVIAALYLREYAKSGFVVSAVRIAVNNLAGVPSIVFGVFGLGFFCYGVGGFIDAGPVEAMPRKQWFLILVALALISIFGLVLLITSKVKPGQSPSARQVFCRHLSLCCWLIGAMLIIILVAFTPFFHGFYRANLPNPTFGKSALIWASLTLALMTLPVVIVSTEEALSAVPNSMREGSYACGASKWQTIKRIVLPRAMPGIMTGMILAMARGAGEVAPLMLVGAVKLAPKLPFSLDFPFGLNRSFMHLGFHIYDLGFQSQNSEAAKPMVFTTTLLLIFIVAALNIVAIWLRSRLKRRFLSSYF